MTRIVWHLPENIEFVNLTDEVERRRLTDLMLRGIRRGIEMAQRELSIETGTGFVMAFASGSGAAEGVPSKEAVLETVPPGIGGGVAREETSTPSRGGVSLKQEKRDLPTAGEAD